MLTVDFDRLDVRSGSCILDAGCGTGRHLWEAYRFDGVSVVGIDLNWEDLRKARYTLFMMDGSRGSSWAVSMADATRLPFRDEVFDVVICSEVLEHVADGRMAAAELVRVLKKGKDLVVSVPRFLPERICWSCPRATITSPAAISGYTGKGNSKTSWKRRGRSAGASGINMVSTRRTGG